MTTCRSDPAHDQLAFDRDGFWVLQDVFGENEISDLIAAVSDIPDQAAVRSRGGIYAVRNLLQVAPAIRKLAHSRKLRGIADHYLGKQAFPVRGILFDKTTVANWLVPWHQDLTIAVGKRLEVAGYGPWTVKAGVWNVQPPVFVLEHMLSLRIHLDDCAESNGALRVIPGTHKLGRLNSSEITDQQAARTAVSCVVRKGGIVLMRPLLLHASSQASQAIHRRVIHLDYASSQLDGESRIGSVRRAVLFSCT